MKLILIFLFSFIVLKPLFADTKFIVIGHLYPITNDEKVIRKLFNEIEELNPNLIFVLGDSSLHDKRIVNLFKDQFKDKVYFSPGNNEIRNGNLNEYLDNVGYLNHSFVYNDINFLLVNSNDNIFKIRKSLKRNISKRKDLIQIILTHHRIWDDTLTSRSPYSHDKSYYFSEVYDLIKDRVHTIFAGNSKRQYFSDYSNPYVNQNVNNIFWVDKIGDINCYSIGTGDGKPKLGFVFVEKYLDKLIVEPHFILNDSSDPIDINKIMMHKDSIKPNNFLNHY
tara:strand:+ start:347 stop:1186 length:840 start_codon:yes stop_codon:yes gene_type:complete